MIIDNIEGIARWLRGHLSVMLNVARSRPVRYIRITPGLSFSNKAIVFDIKKLKFLKLKIRSKTESIVVDQIMVGRCYDTSNLRRHQDIMKRYDEIIRSEMIPLIVDCGGNIGISALWFSEEFKDAQVICIEPSLENVSSAKINAPASETINAAVGAEIGTCEIANPGANSWAYRVAVGTGEIPVFPIEEILIKYPKEKFTPFMIKIDIEGFEGELFSKNTQWIDDFILIIVELHDWLQPTKATSQNFLKSIAQRKRDFIPIGENIFSIKCE